MNLDQLTLFDAAWCQRWTDGEATYQPTGEDGFTVRGYTVRPIDQPAARTFVTRHHYSGTYPADRLRFGLFEGPHLVGVAVIGEPMHPRVTGKVFPTLDRKATAELSRFVLLDHVPAYGETWTLRHVRRYAAAAGLRGLVAFSDPQPRHTADGQLVLPGHVGIIYQASNARYTGRATARTLTVLPDGRVFSDRTRTKITAWGKGGPPAAQRLVDLGASPAVHLAARTLYVGGDALTRMTRDQRAGWVRAALTEIGARGIRHQGNHRFCWVLGDRGARRRTPIAYDALPYPKTIDPV